MENSLKETAHTLSPQETAESGEPQSASNPKADVKVRASETKKSSPNPVPSSTKLKSESTKPVKFAKKMELQDV